MDGIKILKRPRLKKPYLIAAWPGMGEVAFKAANSLVEKLKAEEFAQVTPNDFFYLTSSVIEKGVLSLPELPYNKFFYWKNKSGKNDLIIFISNAQPDLAKAQEYCSGIINLAKSFKVENVVTFAAMPQPVDHSQPSRVWSTATSVGLNNSLKKFNFTPMTEGQISGMNGLFLGIAKQEGIDGFSLLGEIPLYTIQIENPKASYAVLEGFCRVFNIKMDFSDMLEQAHAMEEEINRLLDYLKVGPQGPTPISEEEIERIKKSLNQLTKLPVSVKEKIEKLFEVAKLDNSKARELKEELDRWNAYKDYEDRFLDLFKKPKAKDN